MEKEEIKLRWFVLAEDLFWYPGIRRRDTEVDIDNKFIKQVFHEGIYPAYTENRYYHTFRHIFYMLDNIKDFELPPKDRILLELAIWFHDLVYDTTFDKNEQYSANAFEEFGKEIGLKKKYIRQVKSLIMITTHKKLPLTKLEKIICDLDLREFVSDRQELNAVEVRKEYSHLSDEEWEKSRTEFVESMLGKRHIYHTKRYRHMLEDQARLNLAKEIEHIKK